MTLNLTKQHILFSPRCLTCTTQCRYH